MTNKITKKQMFTAIRAMVEGVDNVGDYTADQVLEFIDTQVAQIDAKAENAKAKAAEKRAKGDELRTAVEAVLTAEYQIADKITKALNRDDVTKAKVTARLTQLVNIGIAEKTQIQTEDKRKIMAYRLLQSADSAENAE